MGLKGTVEFIRRLSATKMVCLCFLCAFVSKEKAKFTLLSIHWYTKSTSAK